MNATTPQLDRALIKIGSNYQSIGYSLQRTVLHNDSGLFYGNRYTVRVDLYRPAEHDLMCRTFAAIQGYIMELLKISKNDLLSGDIWNIIDLSIKFKGE
jgi:hypothetical protein